jgi:hypothetical protein
MKVLINAVRTLTGDGGHRIETTTSAALWKMPVFQIARQAQPDQAQPN